MGRVIHTDLIRDAVRDLALGAAFELDPKVLHLLEEARLREESPHGRDVLSELLENARIARAERRPLCQDTGLAIVWLQLGQDLRLEGPPLRAAVDEGVRSAWREGFLRSSVVRHPLDRVNTGDNTPAFLHVELVEGDTATLRFMAKGGGSENQSRLAVLKPSEGKSGVLRFVLEAVKAGAAQACPPVFIGVGLGGTADEACRLAKLALFRTPGERSKDSKASELEQEILEAVNRTGIGPMGLGGTVTALAAAVELAPCHIASLPVAVAIGCHSHRVRSVAL